MSDENNGNDGSGSTARVAFDLTNRIRSLDKVAQAAALTRKGFLDLYAECYTAAEGQRRIKPD